MPNIPVWIKYCVLVAAFVLPLIAFTMLLNRKEARSWQHYALLIAAAIYCSILCLGVSGYLTSFGYGDAKVEFIDTKVTEAQNILREIKDIRAEVDMVSAIASAKNDDRAAFDKLKAMSKESGNPRSSRAATEVQNLIAFRSFHPSIIDEFSARNSDMNTISIDEVKRRYDKANSSDRSRWIQNSPGIGNSNKAKMEFLIEAMLREPSLQNVFFAQNAFRSLANDPALDKISPYSVEEYVEWWKKNQDRFK